MNDFNLFMAAQFTFLNDDLAFGDLKLFGEEFHQMGIGLPIDRRGGNGDFNSSPCSPTMLSRLAFG